jgi:hypothetical protein
MRELCGSVAVRGRVIDLRLYLLSWEKMSHGTMGASKFLLKCFVSENEKTNATFINAIELSYYHHRKVREGWGTRLAAVIKSGPCPH